MQAVNAEADRVDGRDVELDVDRSGRASSSLFRLNGGMKKLASNIRATRTLLVAGAFIALPAAIGAAVPAVFALSASLGGLALNLGKAAAGFGLVAAAAGGGALVGLKAYGALINKTLTDSRDLWAKSNEEAVKALEKQRTEILLNARGFNAWNSELNESILRFTRLEAAVGSRVFPIFTRELDAWNEILSSFTPQIAATSGRIAQIATGFTRWFRTADDGRVLSEVVDFLSESAVRAAQGLSQIAQIGISAFRPLIPLATDLQGSVLGILSATNRWVQSARGQERLGQIYRSLWADARRLAPVLMDLWRGTVQLFDALDRSGIADQASRGFANLASAYERATRAGGGLDRFLRGARQLMPFVARATMDLVGAIGGIASSAIRAREQGSRLTILEKIFRGISQAANPLRQLMVGTFRDLGPAIARLLPSLVRFFDAFAEGAAGPLVTFINTLARAVRFFNHLPDPVKRTVAQLAALKLILGTMGIGAVVAPMGRFASNMLIARGAAAKLGGRSALGGVAAGLASLTIKGGIIGLAIAGVAGLGFALKRAYDKNKNFRDSVDRLGNKAQKVFSGIQKVINNAVLPALTHLANRGANAILDIFDFNENKKNKIKQAGGQAIDVYGRTLRQRGGKMAEGDWVAELGRKIGQQIGKGLNAWARGGGGGGGGNWLQRILGSNSDPVHFGERLGDNMKKGMNNTNWGQVGTRIKKEILSVDLYGFFKKLGKNAIKRFVLGVTGLGIAADISGWITKQIKKVGVGNLFGSLGKNAAKRFVFGVTGLGIAADISKWITDQIEKVHAGRLFKASGNNAGHGFIDGFKRALTPDGLVNIVKNAIDAVRHFGREGSPWGLTRDMGRNAALGLVGGFRDNLGGVVDAMRSTFDSARQLGPGDPGYLDDGFRKNSRQSAHRGDYGYVQMEDGSWAYNPALYRKQQQMGRTHRYLRGGGGSGFRWNGSEYVPASPRMGGGSRHEAGRMTDEWMRTLRYLRAHPNNYDIGGDVDIKDTPRKILEFLKRDGWFRRGGSLYHPDTPKRYLPGGGGMPRYMGGRGPIDEDGMRRVMREHRTEAVRSGGDAIDYNRLAHAIVGAMQSGLPGFIDNSMGTYFHHRIQAGADPR